MESQLHAHGYEQDFYGWAKEQAQLLREGRLDSIDMANLIDEVEGLARSTGRELRSHLEVLLTDLLKWQFQPAFHCKSWERSLSLLRDAVRQELEESPSLAPLLHDAAWLAGSWDLAVAEAMRQTGFDHFPKQCPWRIDEEVLSDTWLP